MKKIDAEKTFGKTIDILHMYKDKDGKFIHFASPGGYPVIYITKSGEVLCGTCADTNDDDFTEDTLAGAELYYEGPDTQCENCHKTLESAYGDPEA